MPDSDSLTADDDFAQDPIADEEDLGTAEVVSIGDDAPAVSPASESVFSVLTSISEGAIDPQPPYQRRSFWDHKKKAALIESVFLGLPLPLFYLADAMREIEGENTRIREVVDGQQRLSSLKDFYFGKFQMPEDSVVTELQGKKFAGLRPSLKQAFKEFKLSTATIPLKTRADKFDLFKRLNQQSTVLSDQELRNAVYHGSYLEELKTQAQDLKELVRVTEAEWKRMKDVEYLTRLVAFARSGYGGFPNKRLNWFLNGEMELGKAFGSHEKQLIKRVRKSLERVRDVFGDLRFRPYRIPDEGHDGEWARQLNRALMEVQVWALLDHSAYGFADAAAFDRALKDNKGELLENARRLHAYNERFNDTIQRGTTGRPNVEYRFSRYVAAIGAALEVVPDSRRRRFFTAQQKQNIWDSTPPEDRICSECGQPLTLPESEVDHKKPFSDKGETTEANGQLLHRACNRAKGARWDPVDDSVTVPAK